MVELALIGVDTEQETMAVLFGFSYEGKIRASAFEFEEEPRALDAFFDSQGYAKDWKSGLVIPADVVPQRVVRTKGKTIFDFHSVTGAPLVSERFKALVEKLEPGVHQFFPVVVLDGKSRAALPERRFLFNITQEIEAIVESQSNVTADGRGQVQSRSFTPSGPWKMTLDRSKIASRACWVDKRFGRRWFASDTLIAGMAADGMQGNSVLDNCFEA